MIVKEDFKWVADNPYLFLVGVFLETNWVGSCVMINHWH